MALSHERIGESLVFRAGSGEWFNQPGVFLDMGDDLEPCPPSQWHVELQQAIDAQETAPRLVVIDLTGMALLSLGWDFGFLVRLSDQLSHRGTRMAVVGRKNVIGAARIGNLSEFFGLFRSVDEALRSTVRVRWLHWVALLRPTTDLFGGVETDELLDVYKSAWAESHQGIVINLFEVHHMNSSGFGVLMHCLALARRTHTKFALCCINPGPIKISEMTGLGGFQFAFKSEAEAIRYCSER